MLDIEVIGASPAVGGDLGPAEIQELCALALGSAGLDDGHVAVSFVDEPRMRALNREHRGRDAPTDVLSFPVDGPGRAAGPRELGDVAICPSYTRDVREAVLHGTLHLAGMDHETDNGEMLALQAELLRWVTESP